MLTVLLLAALSAPIVPGVRRRPTVISDVVARILQYTRAAQPSDVEKRIAPYTRPNR